MRNPNYFKNNPGALILVGDAIPDWHDVKRQAKQLKKAHNEPIKHCHALYLICKSYGFASATAFKSFIEENKNDTKN